MKRKAVSPKKHLGQHFLNDEAIAHRIAHSVTSNGDQTIIEIGPGTGALTQRRQPLRLRQYWTAT